MNIFTKFSNYFKNKRIERDNRCQVLLNKLNSASAQMSKFLEAFDDYLDYKQAARFESFNKSLIEKDFSFNLKVLKKAACYNELIKALESFKAENNSFLDEVKKHNDAVANRNLEEGYRLVGKVEGYELDKQQMLSIVKRAHSHLVIAGAGTGKTTTIIGKIKYLLNSNLCMPEDILVLSFTNASAFEMKERINKETGRSIDAFTFHKLGLEIIKHCIGISPKITSIKLPEFIKEKIYLLIQNPDYLYMLISYLLFNGVSQKSEFDFSTQQEYEEYLTVNPPTTLRNERVKSYGELEIANFLVQNNIEYHYEKAYPIDTRTTEYSQYIPDFFLPEYNIYIEYFAINEKGEVPSYFSGKDGKSASQSYKESMEWKRELHKQKGTTLIECFAYQKFSGRLLPLLSEMLLDKGVKLEPVSATEIIDRLNSGNNPLLDGFIKLTETVINLIKSNQYTVDSIRKRIPKEIEKGRAEYMLLNLIEPILSFYNQHLAEKEEIDFNDMINQAAQFVMEGKFKHKYKYVIVDEYQDISKGRFQLLHSMRQKGDYDLFCVGDDWQSIYRFAGSDIGFILDFKKYWGVSEISKIETTYRFSQQLVDISGRFIMENPNQVKKEIRGMIEDASFPLGEINAYTEHLLSEFLAGRLDDLQKNSTVFLLGRYGFDIDFIEKNTLYTCNYDNVSGMVQVKYNNRSDLDIRFLTVHTSKGLQADYVFILNNKGSRMGFPSKIQDAPILQLLLENSDTYPHSEERRLFYVALTRAKKKVILLTLDKKESEFVSQLKNHYGEEIKKEAFTCPLCQGRIIKKKSIYGEFWGCTNYRSKGCNYKRKIKRG